MTDPTPVRTAPTSGRRALPAWLVGAGLCLGAVLAVDRIGPSGLATVPFGGTAAQLRRVLASWSDGDVRRARLALDLDYGLIALYVGVLATGCFWRAGVEPRGARRDTAWHRPACFAAIAALAGLCDLGENIVLERAIDTFRRTGGLGVHPGWLAALSTIKVVALAAVLAQLASLVPQRLSRPLGGARLGSPRERPEFLRPPGAPHPWEPPAPGQPARIGVSCAAGGPGAAAFALGALEVLRADPAWDDTRYVSAVGDGALGAATALGANPATSEDRRRALARLLGSRPDRRATVRLLGGLATNLLLAWLLLFAVARPVGWVVSSPAIHPELRAREPIVTVRSPLETESRRLVPIAAPSPGGTAPAASAAPAQDDGTARFELSVDWQPLRLHLSGEQITGRDVRVAVQQTRTGLVGVQDGRLRVLRQPRISLDDAAIVERANDDGSATVDVARQPSFTFAGRGALDPALLAALRSNDPAALDAATVDALRGLIELDRGPRIELTHALQGRPPLRFAPWMVALPLALAAVSIAWYLLRQLWPAARWPLEGLPAAGLAAATASGLVLVVVPLALDRVGGGLALGAEHLPVVGPLQQRFGFGWNGLVPVTAAAAAAAVTAVWSMRRDRPPRTLTTLSTLLLAVASAVAFLDLVAVAAANGPFGHLAGFGLGPRPWSDGLRWLLVVTVLGLAWRGVDARAWSLLPSTVSRLRGGGLTDAPVATERRPEPDLPGSPGRPGASGWPGAPGGPQLIVGASVRLSGPAADAAGRADVPFTFSATELGGPQVGYVATERADAVLGDARRPDLDPALAVALSGSGPPAADPTRARRQARLRAALNLRDGAWLAHPDWLDRFASVEPTSSRWTDRPGWPHLLRELTGRHDIEHRYLFVTGGAGCDRLGLVELLRRGCTEIYCLQALGDDGLRALADAAALARHELGIDVELGPDHADHAGEASQAGHAHLAGRAGTVRYPAASRHDAVAVRGRLMVLGATIDASSPWDLQTLAATDPSFPAPTDGEVLDQLRFEAYRRLGAQRMRDALAAHRPAPAQVAGR